MSASAWSSNQPRAGFTLIEVVGALVIFSVGVLMVMQVSGALGTQMRYAGARSQIAVLANESLDSLEATPLDSIVAGTTNDTIAVQGMTYLRTITVTSLTPVLSRIDVALSPVAGFGPSHDVTSYTSEVW